MYTNEVVITTRKILVPATTPEEVTLEEVEQALRGSNEYPIFGRSARTHPKEAHK